MKKNSKGRYYTIGRKYSGETQAIIFELAIEYNKRVRVFPLPSHLSEMASVSFKVNKKAIMFVFGRNGILHKPHGNEDSGRGSMNQSMIQSPGPWT